MLIFIISLLVVIFLGACENLPLQVPVTADVGVKALEKARDVIGAPYVLGARGPDEFDCSGLITWAYKKALGKDDIFRVNNKKARDVNMQDLWQYNVVALEKGDIMPGDIVFITIDGKRITHGGLFIRWIDDNEFEFINAFSYYGKVVIDTWNIEGLKRGQYFVGAGRLTITY